MLERNSGIYNSKAQSILMVSFLIRYHRPWSLICLLFLPVAMNHQHQQVVATSLSPQNHPTQNPSTGLMSVPTALTTQQQQQQKLRLQRIQMERERIRMRQEELMRQVWSSMVPPGDSVALGDCWLSREGQRLIFTARFLLPTLSARIIFRANLRG